MTLTTHTAIGAVIGASVGNPVLGFVLGLSSHFLVDMIPHGDMFLSENFRVLKQKRGQAFAYACLDVTLGVVLLIILGQFLPDSVTQSSAYIASIVGSVLPDALVGVNDVYKTRLSQAYNRFHFFFHDYFAKHGDVRLRNSLLIQIIFVLGVIYFLG